MKRLFIAIPVSERSKEQIISGLLSNNYVKTLPVRWSKPQNLHLTLQFLGETEEKRISELRQIINRIQPPQCHEELLFSNIGAFPDTEAPKVVWLGINKNEYLLELQQYISDELIKNRFSFDRKKFRAHLTLGRVKGMAIFPSNAVERLNEIRSSINIDNSAMDKIILYESLLRPNGPIYNSIYEKRLN